MTDIIKGSNHLKENYSCKNGLIYLWCSIFAILLMLRDAYSVGVNKYLFILIAAICIFSLKSRQIFYFMCFLFPLYVGLPGNYITLLFLVRFLIDHKKLHIKSDSFIIAMAISIFMLIQNFLTGHMGIVHLMFIPGVLLILFLFSYKDNLDVTTMAICYSFGVASLGLIMLVSTLNVYEFSDLMSTSFRLGSSSVDYVSSGIMNVSVDPNFFGTFAIAAISVGVPIITNAGTSKLQKISLSTALLISLIVCLIGLSRAFILVLALWIFTYIFSQKNIRAFFLTALFIIVLIVLIFNFLPDVAETLLGRFNDSDMSSGNGRTELIIKFSDLWAESILTFIFGVGLFNCNVHCTPLQFLFGGGALLSILLISFVFSLKSSKSIYPKIKTSGLPMFVTFVMMCTVPGAALLNFMFPIVFVGMYNNFLNMEIENEED